jgi:hypothetical protein
MSDSIVAHKCTCEVNNSITVSHGAVYCNNCDGYVCDIDDLVNSNVVKRNNRDKAFTNVVQSPFRNMPPEYYGFGG